MDSFFKSILWSQFGASIDMLENAIRACPDALWTGSRFWHTSNHTLFYLDFYLSNPAPDPIDNFVPPAPFTLSEFDPSGLYPDRAYTKDELLIYLDHCRKKCRAAIEAMTDDQAFAERLLYTMRHVQHHAGQLNFILSQRIGSAPRWVKRTQP
jgi:hypothetical protein